MSDSVIFDRYSFAFISISLLQMKATLFSEQSHLITSTPSTIIYVENSKVNDSASISNSLKMTYVIQNLLFKNFLVKYQLNQSSWLICQLKMQTIYEESLYWIYTFEATISTNHWFLLISSVHFYIIWWNISLIKEEVRDTFEWNAFT